MPAEPFKFKKFDYPNELNNSYLDLNYVNGLYASDGTNNLFVKDGLQDHVFHQFTISSNSNDYDSIIEYHRLRFTFKQRDGTSQPTSLELRWFKDLSYYNNHLLLFSRGFKQCLIYDCKDLYWYIENLLPNSSVKSHDHEYIFVYYKRYIIIFYDQYVRAHTNDLGLIHWPTVPLDSHNVLNTHLCRARTIIKDRYLLVINQSQNCTSPSAYIIDIRKVVDAAQWSSPHVSNSKTLRWTTVSPFDLTQGLGELYIQSKEIYCLYNETSDNILICNVNLGIKKHLICKIYDRGDPVVTSLKEESNINWNGEICSTVKLNKGIGKHHWSQEYAFFVVGNRIVVIPYKTDHSGGNVKCVYVSSAWPFDYGTNRIPRARYSILNKIGLGGSSQVYLGKRLNDNSFIVVKQMSDIQHDGTSKRNLEEKIYRKLKANQLSWISCNFHECIRENKLIYLIFEKLGVSLQHLLNEKNGTMNLNQVLGILDRMITILCKLHSIGYVHNDIKPENILIGNNDNDLRSNKIYLIDFGIATPFWNFKNNKHLSIKTGVSFNGTFRFSSKNHHCNAFSTSRRDDLESLIYFAIYLLTGKLPWIVKNDIDSNSLMTKEAILGQTKMLKQEASPHQICLGLPPPFEMALIYLTALKFDDKPDYSYLQKLFRQLHISELHTQLITANALLRVTNNTNTNEESDGSNVVAINNLEFCGYVDFLGIYVPIAQNDGSGGHDQVQLQVDQADQSEEKKVESKEPIDNIDDKHDKHDKQTSNRNVSIISEKLTDIAVKQLNKMEKNGTITNHPTHMSVYGMRNRFGYLIDSLTVTNGVPNKLPTNISYAGIIIYQESHSSENSLNGQIYMLSSPQCEITNKEYANRTGQQLGGVVHGAVYYHYFKQNIFNTNDKNRQHKLSFIRGFSFGANGELKCRSGAFNFIGYKLIDDKYKPLAKCEEKFIHCALKRYCNDKQNKITTFAQFITYDQYSNNKYDTSSNINGKNVKSDSKSKAYSDVRKLVPEYEDNDVDSTPIQVYSKVKLLWETNVIAIIEYLSNQDKIELFYVSKQAQLLMNMYCVWKSKCNHHRKSYGLNSKRMSVFNWCYNCKIKEHIQKTGSKSQSETTTLTTVSIKQLANKHLTAIQSGKSTLDLRNFSYNYIGDRKTKNSLLTFSRFLLVDYHPHMELLAEINKHKSSLQRVDYCQKIRFLLLLKMFGIYDNFKDTNKTSYSTTPFEIDGNKYLLQPQWSWERNGKWMNYDDETCLQIENSYRNGDTSIMLSKGMYSHGQYKKLYKILFKCKHSQLNASNQSQVDDIYNDKKWKNNIICKYFYQQNVQNKWVRIVRHDFRFKESDKDCVVM